MGSFAPTPTCPTSTNFASCACGNPWGTRMDHACAQLDGHGCRTLLQYARMYHLETFLHGTRHTHTIQSMRKSTSVCTHACTLQHAHVHEYIRTHPNTRTSYDHPRLEAYETPHTLLFGTVSQGAGQNNLRSGPDKLSRSVLSRSSNDQYCFQSHCFAFKYNLGGRVW